MWRFEISLVIIFLSNATNELGRAAVGGMVVALFDPLNHSKWFEMI